MKYLKLILCLLCGLTLSGCVYEVDPGYPSRPGHPGGGHGGHHGGNEYYRDGYQRGETDARRGLNPSPARHWGHVPRSYRNDYARGYNRGYESRRPNNPGGGGNYYSTGTSAGASDKRRGLSYQPSRHWNSVPRHGRDDFSRGYAVGFRQSPVRPLPITRPGYIPPNMRR